jgi:23S rRNA (pseudouridine1915-N3)-methyltransferase
MKIRIICVGTLSSRPMKELVNDYYSRLRHYTDIDIIEVAESASDNIEEEALKIKEVMVHPAKTIALAIEGKPYSSSQFAQWIDDHQTYESMPLQFIIGGSNGLASSLKTNTLSFSAMTLPHQLMRVFLLEQLYRSYKILRNEPYHK